MDTSELKKIAERLRRENICTLPLSEKELQIIADFAIYRNTNSELMRRLSNVEINYVQIRSEADDAKVSAATAKEAISDAFKVLTDSWRAKGIVRDFVFSYNEEETALIKSELSAAIESVKININTISSALMTLAETSAQMRACSASFTEIYNESKLGVYAGFLNRDKEEILDCRAISLQAHASSSESNRASASYLATARSCTRVISIINELITESSTELYSSIRSRIFSPFILSKRITDAIHALNYINL